MINYSIIIPHYNIPNLLMRCIRSIPKREDVEVIVVDDNSFAGESYPQHYPELSREGLRYIHLDKNIGGGGARNVGLEYAQGKWLLFADADDFFSDKLYMCLTKYIDCEADVVYFNVNGCQSDNINLLTNRNKQFAFDEYKKTGDERIFRFWYTEPWGKMISKSMVDKYNIRFDETPVANDYLFSVKIGYYARKIAVDNTSIYWYCSRENSITISKKNIEKDIQRVFAYARVQEFMQSVGYYTKPGLTSHILNGLFKHNVYTYIKTVCRLHFSFGISFFQSITDLLLHYKMKLKGTPFVYGDVYHMDFIKKQ